MAKFILTPNPNPPFNLMRRQPVWNHPRFQGMTDDAIIDAVVVRLKETGGIPCESEAERNQVLLDFTEKHKGHLNVVPLVLPPPGLHWVIDEADLPGGLVSDDNDYFFDCWELGGTGCVVNMSKARGMQMDKIRLVRNKELVNLDVPFMKALEDGDTDTQATIKSKKRELRDIPQTFDLTTDTPEQLKQKWPEGLPKDN